MFGLFKRLPEPLDKDERIRVLESEVTRLQRCLEKQTGKLMSTRCNEQERKDLRKIVAHQRLELYRLNRLKCSACWQREKAAMAKPLDPAGGKESE